MKRLESNRMKSEEGNRKRKQKKRSSSMGSNIDKEMDEVEEFGESTCESESGSDSSFDLCKDIDNVERNVVPAEITEIMKSETASEGMSSDYDFCDVDEKDGSIDETMKSSKMESSNAVSDNRGVDKSSIDEVLKSSKGSMGTASDIGVVDEDFVDAIMKSSITESLGAVTDDIRGVENDSINASVKSPAESTRVFSDVGVVEKGSRDKSKKSSTAELSGAVSDIGGVSKGSMQIITLEAENSNTIDKVNIDEPLKSSKDDLSGAVSEPESDSDVESQGSEDTDGSMDVEDYYDEQYLAEITKQPSLAPGYEQLCTSYQEFKVMHQKHIIMEHALPYLPAKALTRFRSVSKAWDMQIQSSFLAHQQSYKFRCLSGYFHERYTGLVSFTSLRESSYGVPNPHLDFLPVLNGKLSVVGASNGLLLCKASELTYFICNPATEKWKMLPQPRFYHGEKPAIAFAFEPSVLNMEAHYELICAFPRLDEPVVSLEIYSSTTKEWRCVDSLCSELAKSKLKSNGFYFNGMAYWETESNEVLAFDINSGIHGVLSLPSALTAGGALGQMGGEVCYVCAQKLYGSSSASIFKVSVYEGMHMDLKKSVELNLGSGRFCGGRRSWDNGEEEKEYCRVMPFFTDNMVTLLVDDCFHVCDLKKRRVKTSFPGKNLHADANYWPYVNSLVCV